MKVGFLGLSNPVTYKRIEKDKEWLENKGIEVVVSELLFRESTGKERAEVFNDFLSKGLDYIFDVSGGDLANEVIPYIDYQEFKTSNVTFFGYSDLTCVINALYAKTGKSSILYQICSNTNKEELYKYMIKQNNHLLEENDKRVIGGNIRCFLKLAGTSYFPDYKGKTLFLESYSGNEYRIRAYFAQLNTMGVFNQIQDLILGQFTEMDDKYEIVVEIAKKYVSNIKINQRIGHSHDSKGLRIG